MKISIKKNVLTALVAVFVCVQSYALEKITSENYEDYGFTSENYTEYLDYYAIATAQDLADFRDRINYSSDYSNAVVVANEALVASSDPESGAYFARSITTVCVSSFTPP